MNYLFSYLWYQLNLLNCLTFYLLLMFAASTWRRMRQYGEYGKLAVSLPQRWPRLLKLVRQHRMVFLTWKTAAPSVLMLTLSLIQFLLTHYLLPSASDPQYAKNILSLHKLFANHIMWPIAAVLGAGVLTYDIYFMIVIGKLDRPMLEKYFDQAEFWLKSPAASVVKFFTLGRINPRGMVAEEVRKALIGASGLVNTTLWWISLSTGLRIAFGVALWIAWAWE